MYTSTMPLKMNIDPEIQNSTFMIQAHKELNDCYFHQKYPYDILIEDILLKQQGKDQLFQHCINYSNARTSLSIVTELTLKRWTFSPVIRFIHFKFLLKTGTRMGIYDSTLSIRRTTIQTLRFNTSHLSIYI